MIKNKFYITNTLSFFIYLSYFLGFYFNENSIGSGGYNSDLSWIWDNFEIFKNKGLIEGIKSDDFFGNRSPFLYIINIYFNPFVNDIDSYRTSIFLLSLLGPIILYFCLTKKYKNIKKEILFLISSVLLLSPFYRTNAYWGMEINYGIITTLISLFYLINFKESFKTKFDLNLFLLIFFSSMTVYFDQKLIIVPLISFITIISGKLEKKNKIISTLLYFIFSLPFIYLITIWEGIVPKATQLANPNTITNFARTNNIYFYNIGYASTIIAFYLLPYVFFKRDNIFVEIQNFLISKKNKLLILLPVFYLITLITFYEFKFYTIDNYWIGFGIIHKISLYLFKNINFQEIFTYTSMLISWLIIIFVLEKKLYDYLLIIYFFILSLLLWPLMQEYFDPTILIISLILFKTRFFIKFYNSLILVFYYLIFLIGSNLHYANILF